MSSGDFIISKCEDTQDPTIVYKCRVQKETLDASIGSVMNTEATMDVNQAVSAWIGKSNRQLGFRPAIAYFRWQDGQIPANYTGQTGKIVLLTQAAYKAAVKMGAEITYLTKMADITSVDPSDAK
ncbi:MAG: hypothetical protein AB4352_21290 [Hormoscilla sp.]